MKRAACLLLVIAASILLRGDMVVLTTNQQYQGIIFSEDGDPVLKLMQANGEPVYVNKKFVKLVTPEDVPNKADKIAMARLQDQMRVKERELALLREAFEKLQAENDALRNELQRLRAGGDGQSGYKSPAPAPFIKLVTYESRHSMDTLKISGVIQNVGASETGAAEIAAWLYDEDGKIVLSRRYHVLKDGATLPAGAMKDFEISDAVGRDMINKMTTIKVTAVNEADEAAPGESK